MTADVRDYLTALPYPERFHPEHAPSWLHATLTALGYKGPDARRGRWCEIGCGTGYGTCILAAANPGMRFVGIDINASHIEVARRRVAQTALTNVSFIHQDISEPTQDLGHFDFIIAHGVYSWVSPQVRDAMMAFASRSLATDGVFYLHYMSHPGAAAFAAFHTMFRLTENSGSTERRVDGIRAGLDLLENLRRSGAGYFIAHPAAASTLQHLQNEDAGYIAHEYLNDHFEPMHVADVMHAGRCEGLTFVGSATPIENIDSVSVPANTLPVIRQMKDPLMRETLKDMARNQSLRRDLYMRQPSALDDRAHTEALNRVEFCVLPNAPASGPIVFETRIGAIQASETAVSPVLSNLHQGHRSFAQLSKAIPNMPTGMLNQTLHLLMGAGIVHPLVSAECDEAASERLNAVLLERMRLGAPVPALASARIGSGLPL